MSLVRSASVTSILLSMLRICANGKQQLTEVLVGSKKKKLFPAEEASLKTCEMYIICTLAMESPSFSA